MRDSQLTGVAFCMTDCEACENPCEWSKYDTVAEIADLLEEIEDEMNENVAELVLVESHVTVKGTCPYCDGVGCVSCHDLGHLREDEANVLWERWATELETQNYAEV